MSEVVLRLTPEDAFNLESALCDAIYANRDEGDRDTERLFEQLHDKVVAQRVARLTPPTETPTP